MPDDRDAPITSYGTIRNVRSFLDCPPAAFDGMFHWAFLKGAFRDTKIMPMDWDAVVERNGHFLILETKHPGVVVPDGQLRALERAVCLPKSMSILILEGKKLGDFVSMTLLRLGPDGQIIRLATPVRDQHEVWRQAARWYDWADGSKRPDPHGHVSMEGLQALGKEVFG